MALREYMNAFAFASCVPFSSRLAIDGDTRDERTGIVLRAAALDAAADALLEEIESLFELCGSDTVRYADRRHGQRRCARLARGAAPGDADTRVEGFLLAGDTRSGSWLGTLLQDGLPAQAYGRLLLSGSAEAPVALAPRARQVCNCHDISEPAIVRFLQDCPASGEEARLDALRSSLRCGTSCGSCNPQLRELVRAQPVPMPIHLPMPMPVPISGAVA